MNAEISKAHIDALSDWASSYEREKGHQCEEIAFLLRRSARMIGHSIGIDIPFEERKPSEPPVTEVKEG